MRLDVGELLIVSFKETIEEVISDKSTFGRFFDLGRLVCEFIHALFYIRECPIHRV